MAEGGRCSCTAKPHARVETDVPEASMFGTIHCCVVRAVDALRESRNVFLGAGGPTDLALLSARCEG